LAERIQKIIAARGLMSRRAAERCIEAGRVTVDGRTASLGQSADPDKQLIRVDGEPLPPPPDKQYILFHKPRGVVTTRHDPQGRRTVMQCLPGKLQGLLPVGRLDMLSEGLLLLSNDGAFVKRLTHPSHEIEKEYHVSVRGDLDAALPVLYAPMELDGEPLAPARAEKLSDTRISVVIREGKNRQVRRMCEKAGLIVRRLVRVRQGSVTLGKLAVGECRVLTQQEIRDLTKGAAKP